MDCFGGDATRNVAHHRTISASKLPPRRGVRAMRRLLFIATLLWAAPVFAVTLFSDTFTRTDRALDGDGNWAAASGTPRIKDFQVSCGTGGDACSNNNGFRPR